MSSGARRSTPRGQMTRGANSGPAVMLMPPHIRATFMPNPPLQHLPKTNLRRKQEWTGVSSFLKQMIDDKNKEKQQPADRLVRPTPKSMKEKRMKLTKERHEKQLEPKIDEFRKEQKRRGGEFEGMNCYNTLFVGRLAYEVTERKLLREMEAFGPVKDIRIIKDKKEGNNNKSRGYAFVEYEHEEDMKRAYRAADGMKIEGREIVVDVERGHTVPTFLPRRLGGGFGGTRLGGKDVNVTRPGRYDPSKPEPAAPMGPPMGGPPPPQYGGSGRYGPQPPAPPYGGRGRGGGDRYGGPPPPGDRYGGPPPPRDWDGGRKRRRSNSPDRRQGGRRRY